MKGRKPRRQNVVPLTGDGFAARNHDAAAREKARQLKPRALARPVAKIWDEIAPSIAHPTVNRLTPHYVPMFVELCEAFARLRALRAEIAALGGETYETETRNGMQRKNHPEVGQLNEVLRQVMAMADRFGMTPAAARGLAVDQGELFDDTDAYFKPAGGR